MAQTYLAFLFWSVLTSHPIVVWYFPLYNMGISGAEVFVLSMCAPMLLTNAAVRRVSLGGRRNLELLGLVALLATWSPSPVLRLLANGIGLFGSFVAWALHLTDAAAATRHEAQAAFVLGLLLNNIARIHGYSNNPVWAVMKNDALSGGYNLFGIALTFVAMAVVYSPSALVAHPRSQPAAVIGQREKERSVAAPATAVTSAKTAPSSREVGWRGPAFAYGATLHGVHTLLTESGVVARWTVDGTPAENVDPLVGGVVTTAAMMLGLVAWTQRPQWAQSRFAWAAASAGVMALYALPIYVPTRASRYVAFALGNVYVAWQTMQLPAVFEQTAHVQRKRVFVVGSLVYITLFLSAIWTVAYEFVPGGFLLRERTWLVMLIQVLCAAGGVVHGQPAARVSTSPLQRQRPHPQLWRVLGLLSLLTGAAVTGRIMRRKTPQPTHPAAQQVITAGIWTVHFGIDDDLYSSHDRMRHLIEDMELDVVGLLETDTMRPIMANRDLTQYLAERLGMYADYGPAPTKHTWGAVLLSKWPILSSSHHLLPSPVGELAPAIFATLDVNGQPVDVIVSHNGQSENLEDRRQQTTYLAELARHAQHPIIFLGYVVTDVGMEHEIYRLLMNGGRLEDIYEDDWDRWCEYIASRGLQRIGYARLSHGGITDTELQVGRFRVAPPGQAAYATYPAGPGDIPAAYIFPLQFLSEGTRGHKYHRWHEIITPKYWWPRASDDAPFVAS